MKRILSLVSVVLLSAVLLISCTPKQTQSVNVKVAVLNGTTGMGIAKMINDADEKYTFTVETDASNITAALISGDMDIAALPTNAAANLYNKTDGKIKVIAINTLGVLYTVTNGVEISSVADLDGKTVYCPAQNPLFIAETLFKAADINVTISTEYAQPADLRTAVAAGKVQIAILPEPMVSIACSANNALKISLNLTVEWNKYFPENSLVQGCTVVRTQFAEEHPKAIAEFLKEYKASVEFTVNNPSDASEMIEKANIGKIGADVIPNCNLCYLDGDAMRSAFSAYLEILYNANPSYVGGKLPDGNFYYEK